MSGTTPDSPAGGLVGFCGDPVRRTCRLDGPDAGWLVTGGEADLFAVRRPGLHPSRRFHVARLPAGALLSTSTALGAWQFILVPLPGTELRGLGVRELSVLQRQARRQRDPADPTGARARAAAAQLVDAVDLALLTLADAMRPGQAPREASTLPAREIVSLAQDSVLTANGGVWWLRCAGGHLRRNDGGPGETVGAQELLLFAGRDWVVADSPCVVESQASVDLLAAGQLQTAVDQHLAGLLRTVEARVADADAALLSAVERRRQADAAVVAAAARRAIGVIGAGEVVAEPEQAVRFDLFGPAAAVLRAVTAGWDATVEEPTDRSRTPDGERAAVHAVARASGLFLREVRLPERWWRRDLGPLIGWRDGDDGGPPVAVPMVFRRGHYHRVDPETRVHRRVSPAFAAELAAAATQVQAPLPHVAALRHLLRAGLVGAAHDVRTLLLTASCVAVLGLGVPLATGAVLGQLARRGEVEGLSGFLVLMLSAAVVAGLLGVAQNLLLLRLDGRMQSGVQLALWDRLMRLPARFFSRRSSGEIANSLLGVAFVGEALSALLPQLVTAAATVLVTTAMLLVVQPVLGLWGLGVVGVCVLAFTVFTLLVLRRQRAAVAAEHRAAAMTNQLLGAIVKLKLAAAESRAHARWSELAATARAALQRVRQSQAGLIAFATVLPVAGQLVLFAVLMGPLAGQVSPTDFFVLNVGFAMLLGALLVLVSAGVEVVAAVPRLGSLRDILRAEPEARPDRVDPGELRGGISLHRLTFAYQPDDPPVLVDVDLQIRPGEFVAVVGPSGCGKSTLLRLLLGFERPQQGAVLYDGQDLSELDAQAVRRQCGVVLQDGQLFAGSVRDNICGAGGFTLDEVWEAARMAGLADDLEALPMGMSTMVPFGGGTLSVGQRQRVLIARAVAPRPRILFFDEATSALDNRTQEVVTRSTATLAATRLVIAHRLSTVRDADVIVVLDQGRIVQRGSYDELMGQPDGLFHRLARRQLLADPEGRSPAAGPRSPGSSPGDRSPAGEQPSPDGQPLSTGLPSSTDSSAPR
ncbi:ATP-binding cassette domain-containing protein [Micromonospora rifamycinica]|uniref:NHLM bacteriocin system ABC transporter, ATP-binding protein n=1 Tax=Micromonospora rifamycinica TaxID=291594 RepID=A0A1C5H6F0_9ACTN|nr:ATP-binding cassette domain-containing protein [Micromonospora rifamycinica]SCG41609.1 NHLM bacteriocin system ABC transporter, ATP-binding protein [Micromonospora rifamycinica]